MGFGSRLAALFGLLVSQQAPRARYERAQERRTVAAQVEEVLESATKQHGEGGYSARLTRKNPPGRRRKRSHVGARRHKAKARWCG